MSKDHTSLERLQGHMEESRRLSEAFWRTKGEAVVAAGGALVEALRAGHKVLLFGNGGSAADAQHLADELVNRFETDRPALPAVALTTDSSNLTAIANDIAFEAVFSRQVEALGLRGDVAVGISTSGTSPNIVRALETARAREMTTLGILGRDGGPAASLCDHPLVVEHRRTARIQEVHLQILHALCHLVDEAYA